LNFILPSVFQGIPRKAALRTEADPLALTGAQRRDLTVPSSPESAAAFFLIHVTAGANEGGMNLFPSGEQKPDRFARPPVQLGI